jgi:Flp pilus assembly protein TadG
MLLPKKQGRRQGAVVVECAIVYPVVFLLTISMLVGAQGVYVYQEMSHLAREASRWASLHGTDYQQDNGKPPTTQTDVYNNVIAPNLYMLDASQLTYAVVWNPTQQPYNVPLQNFGASTPYASSVTVTLQYQWNPVFFFSPMTLQSTSQVQQLY